MSEMQILNLIQGSDEWLAARLKYLGASEAPAMMGESKFMTRNQLLDLKKGWQKNPAGHFLQKLYDDGHEQEDKARVIVELEECIDYPPIVGMRIVDGLKLLASFDGLPGGVPGEQPWEHKGWNSVLPENVNNGVLTGQYYWQLEHQCIVNGCGTVLFVCSDGGEVNRVSMVYTSLPERRAELLAGWKQFMIDLESHEIAAKVEQVVAKSAETFPLITYTLDGANIVSNISQILPIYKERADAEMNRELVTDQDFADKEELNKATKKARESLKSVVENAKSEYVSYSDFSDFAAKIDSVLQKMQSHGEKQVKQEKERIKGEYRNSAECEIVDYVGECNLKIAPFQFSNVTGMSMPDFDAAMKNKRNLESLKSAADDLVAKTKIEIDKSMLRILPNIIFMREHAEDFKFLFNDASQIINQDTEPFQAVVKSRIADHKEKEEEKAKKERERIREEERLKLEREAEAERLRLLEAEKVKEPVTEPEPIKAEPARTETPQPVEEVKTPAATSEPATTGDDPRDTIYNAVVESFMGVLGIDKEAATLIADSLDRGLIKHASINY